MNNIANILIIYTGGTIGMVEDPDTNDLIPFDFNNILARVPELRKLGFHLSAISFEPPIDSSDITPETWSKLALLIHDNYDLFDGFVVLHGTDTMAYTASALSFMFGNLQKPVIFTGSQLPIGTLRTDGKENLITSVEIAASRRNDQALVPEVCIYFESNLYRANRTKKHNVENFDAFRSYNYPALAKAGIHINYNYAAITYPTRVQPLSVQTRLDTRIASFKLFPGRHTHVLEALIHSKKIRSLIVETYGAGNAPQDKNLLNLLRTATDNGILVVNVTQCTAGSVDMELYRTGKGLLDAGVVSGRDITFEAAVTKLMCLLGRELTFTELANRMSTPMRGEMSPSPTEYPLT